MGISFGAILALHRDDVSTPLTLWQRAHGPLSDLDLTNSLASFVELVHGGRARMLLEETHIHEASSRHAETLAVTACGRCVVLFDRWGVLNCEAETPGALSGFDRHLAEVSKGAHLVELLVCSLDSVSDTYFFAVFRDGVRVRRWSELPTDAGAIGVDEGAPLPTEPSDLAHGQERIDQASRHVLGGRTLLDVASRHDGRVFVVEYDR